ncbi:site-specific integrase [Lysinibacillus sp. NPDC098008]|uniref:site-specific integrase n=1 Tax=Lysinibacillus sp. NPDC098008 TaxID=3364146 RepID=UPI00380658AE
MARKGRTSIVREVKESIDAIDKIGQSKREAKRNGTQGIHSVKQKQNTMSDAQNFVKWVRAEHGVKSIVDLRQEHYAMYMAYMADKGLSKGHMQNVETSLRLLERGFAARLERLQSPSVRFEGFCPPKRLVTVKMSENVRNRAYSEREVQAIRAQCSPEVQKAVDLMRELGLRVREAANVRTEHFVVKGGSWYLEIAQGRGITKGGRFRCVPVPKTFEQQLAQLLAEKQPEERLVRVASGTIRDGVNVACKKANVVQAGRGCHGFRHAYARDRLAQLATKEQRDMMQRILANREQGRKADYGILSEQDQALYVSTKAVMDKIHGELGHGKNRWELAMRYLR